MIDKTRQKLTINCSSCHTTLTATLGQVSRGQTITYHRCRQKIKLQEKGNGIRSVQRLLSELERTLKRFGK